MVSKEKAKEILFKRNLHNALVSFKRGLEGKFKRAEFEPSSTTQVYTQLEHVEKDWERDNPKYGNPHYGIVLGRVKNYPTLRALYYPGKEEGKGDVSVRCAGTELYRFSISSFDYLANPEICERVAGKVKDGLESVLSKDSFSKVLV